MKDSEDGNSRAAAGPQLPVRSRWNGITLIWKVRQRKNQQQEDQVMGIENQNNDHILPLNLSSIRQGVL